MKTLTTLTAVAALGFASVLPAQEPDSKSDAKSKSAEPPADRLVETQHTLEEVATRDDVEPLRALSGLLARVT